MKQILVVLGGLSVLGGFVAALVLIAQSQSILRPLNADPTSLYILAAAYVLSGLIGSVVFFALATIIGKLEALERRR